MTSKRVLQMLVLSAAFLALGTDVSAQTGAGAVPRGVRYMRGAVRNAPASASPAAGAANNPQNMTYFGGEVLPNATTYAIWWGNPSAFPPDAREGIDDFLENLDGSAYLAIADQYMFGQKTHTHFGGNLFDSSAPPVQLTDTFVADVVAEVYKVLTANGMKADPAALYAVYVSNFPNESFFCAFHNFGAAPDGTPIHILYVPNSTFALSGFGCTTNSDPLFTPNRHSEATRAMSNSTAHEVMESITDPNYDAWNNATTGAEIGDLCNFVFESPVPLPDSSRWKIQEIWSNEAGGCVQGAGRNARVLGAFSRSRAITTFDIPASAYGTFSQSTNIFGAVAGSYDASFQLHAFLRDSLGNIATIDPPGTGPGGAAAFSINADGAIAGDYGDTNFALHGFVRDHQGNFVTIDSPGAVGTLAISINNEGGIAGLYFDANSVDHGFVRDALGNIATFDAPGAVNAPFGGTFPQSINVNGAVTGNYLDANFLSHGFVRHKDGTIATFDAPGASQGTFPQRINDLGTIAGYFTDANFVSHGFVRNFLGNITTFDDPNSSFGTFGLSINAFGAVGGYYSDASGFPQSFVRDASGRFSGLSAAGNNFGTVVRSINAVGATAGYETAATP